MRIKLPHAPYIARKIANDLLKSGFIKFTSGTEPVAAVAQDILYADINKERALEERVKELLEQNATKDAKIVNQEKEIEEDFDLGM